MAVLALMFVGASAGQTPPPGEVLRPPVDRWITSGDRSGFRVAMTADTALVAVPEDDVRVSNEGSVYVLRLTPSGWRTEARLLAPIPAVGLHRGVSLGINGNLAVVGLPASHGGSGRVHLYRRSSPHEWTHEAELSGTIASDPLAVRGFGTSVAVFQDTVLVGTGAPVTTAPGVVSPAFSFRRVGSQWQPDGELAEPPPGPLPSMGVAASEVALGIRPGTTNLLAAVRRPDIAVGAARISFVQLYEGVNAFGPRQWRLLSSLSAPVPARANAQQGFGETVRIDGSWLFVGNSAECGLATTACGYLHAWRLLSGPTLLQFSQSIANPGGGQAFAAAVASQAGLGRFMVGYGSASNQVDVFTLGSSGQWQPSQAVQASGVGLDEGFGLAIAAADQQMLIGSPDFSALPMVGTGRVFSYLRVATDWVAGAALDMTEPPSDGRFGAQIAIADQPVAPGSLLVAEPLDTFQDGIVNGGSVHVYDCVSRPCRHVPAARLQSPTPSEDSQFGRTLAVDPRLNLVAVSERRAGGRVQLYRRSSSTQWQHLRTIAPPSQLGSTWDFGTHLSLYDGWLAVRAQPASGTSPDAGRVIVARYAESGASIVAPQVLQPEFEIGRDQSGFGAAMAFSPSPFANAPPSLLVGVPAARDFSGPPGPGLVARYEWDTTVQQWWQAQRIEPEPSLPAGARFGTQVASGSGDVLIAAPGVSPERVYRFVRNASSGLDLAATVFAPTSAGTGSGFGNSLAIAEFDRYVIGAPLLANQGGCYQLPMSTTSLLGWCPGGAAGSRLGESLAASRRYFAAGAPAMPVDVEARLGGGMVLVSAPFSATELLAPEVVPAIPTTTQPAFASVEYRSLPLLDASRRLDVRLGSSACSITWNTTGANGLRFGCSLSPAAAGAGQPLQFHVRPTANHQSAFAERLVDVMAAPDRLFGDGFEPN